MFSTKPFQGVLILALTFLQFIFFSSSLIAQPGEPGGGTNPALDEEPFQIQSLLNQQIVVPPSPEAASLGQYGNVQVSPYTGGLNFSIPIQGLQGRELSFPVALNYSGNGVKVNELPTWVGIGWTLQAGGVITRSVVGNPDMSYNYYGRQLEMNEVRFTTDQFRKNELMYDVSAGGLETQPDVYYVSFPGFSGKFYITPSKKVIFKSDNDIKLTVHWGANDDGDIESFDVYDGIGNRYWFDRAERTELTLDDEQIDPPAVYSNHEFNSSWYLSKIESVSKREVITISYDIDPTPFEQPSTAFAQDTYTYFANRPSDGCGGFINDPAYQSPSISVGGAYSINQITNRRFLSSARLTRNGEQVAQLYFESSNTTKSYGAYQYNEWQLDRIDYQLKSGRTKYQNTFSYSHATGRLTLESFQPYNFPAGKDYEFNYNSTTLPSSVESTKIDHWGFYNSNWGGSLVPSIDICNTTVSAGSADRETDPQRVKAASLEEIHYPTGGFTEITFEAHRVPYWGSCSQYFGTEKDGGGIRVKYIDDYSAPGQRAVRKEYRYVKSTGGTSGRVLRRPSYTNSTSFHHFPEITLSGGGCNPANADYTQQRFTVFSSSRSSLGAVQGSNVGYSRVEEINAGKTVYHYRNNQLSHDRTDEHENGLLAMKEVFDSSDKLLARWEMDYANVGNKTNDSDQDVYNFIAFTVEAKSLQSNQTRLCLDAITGQYSWHQQYESVPNCFTSRVFKTKFETKPYSLKQNNWAKTSEKVTQYFYDNTGNSAGEIEKIRTFNHDDGKTIQPTSVSYTDSDGKVHEQTTRYTNEESPLPSGTSIIGFNLENMPARQTSQLYAVDNVSLYKGKNEIDPLRGYPKTLLNRFRLGSDRVRESIELHGSSGEPLQTRALTDVPTSYVWAYSANKLSAVVKNAEANQVAFTSFEDNLDHGGWTVSNTIDAFPYYVIDDPTRSPAKVGGGSSRANTLTKSGLPGGNYIVSYWTKAPSNVYLNQGTQISIDISPVDDEGWYYVERKVSVSYSGAIQIGISNYTDEVRLYPADALMTSYTYDRDHQNLRGMGDERGMVQKFDYDAYHRLTAARDFDGNILNSISYHFDDGGNAYRNLITKKVLLVPGKTTATEVNATGYTDLMWSNSFVDGLGRPLQSVMVKESPTAKDIITPVEYDTYGRQTKSYLPYTIASTNGSYHSSAFSDQTNFYSAAYGASDAARAFSENILEVSPFNRPIESKFPGSSYSQHPATVTYRANTANEVRDLTAASAYYSANSLLVIETIDGDGRLSRKFISKSGRTIRTDQEDSKTYFLYDGLGNTLNVVQPQGSKIGHNYPNLFIGSSWLLANTYDYEYSSTTNLLLSVRRPGEGQSSKTEYFYDELERPVLIKQPAGTKEFTKFDVLGRPIMTGTYSGTALPGSAYGNFETKTHTNSYKYTTSGSFPTSNITVMTVQYYDDYNFDANGGNDVSYSIPSANGTYYPSTKSMFHRGLQTGGLTAVLPDNGVAPSLYLASSIFYDDRGRETLLKSDNHLSGEDRLWTDYNFAGWPLRTRHEHSSSSSTGGATSLVVNTRSTYDHRGRVIDEFHQIGDGGPEKLLARHAYDEWGREKSKNIGGYAPFGSYTFAQTVNFAYNINGWLTDINNAYETGVSDDLFAMKLHYDIGASVLNAGAQYSGNISGIDWTYNPGGSNVHSYGFEYDSLSRLTRATYAQRGVTTGALTSSISDQNRYDLSEVSYDENGNILRLKRRGQKSDNTFGLIDDIYYNYDATRKDLLTSVVEASDLSAGMEAPGSGYQYFSYDNNGRTTQMKHREISQVRYNHLSLPRQFIFNNGSSNKVVYDASGTKLSQTGRFGSRRDYIAGLEYQGYSLVALAHSAGRAVKENGSWKYEYVIQDHLGNARVRFRESGGNASVLSQHDYYPFGMENNALSTQGTGDPFQYRYNGKELNEDLGLYDYGARWYDPAIGRWNAVDPLADAMPGWSPYNYVMGNPVSLVDPDGRAPQHIEPITTKGGGKDGRDLVTYKVTGKIINRSSSEVNMEKILADVISYVENEFQGQDIDGVDYKVELDFSIANSMDEVSESDHLLSLVDEITLTSTKTKNGVASTETDDAYGVVSNIGHKAAFVDVSAFTGPYDSTVGSMGAYSAAHEIGHLLGLHHGGGAFNLMKKNPPFFSSGNWSTGLKKDRQCITSNGPGISQIGS